MSEITYIIAEPVFQNEKITVKGQIRKGRGADTRYYDNCLFLENGGPLFGTDKFEIQEYDLYIIRLVTPLQEKLTRKFSNLEIPYKIDVKKELDYKTPGSWVKCPKCNLAIPLTKTARELAAQYKTTLQLCECEENRFSNQAIKFGS